MVKMRGGGADWEYHIFDWLPLYCDASELFLVDVVTMNTVNTMMGGGTQLD